MRLALHLSNRVPCIATHGPAPHQPKPAVHGAASLELSPQSAGTTLSPSERTHPGTEELAPARTSGGRCFGGRCRLPPRRYNGTVIPASSRRGSYALRTPLIRDPTPPPQLREGRAGRRPTGCSPSAARPTPPNQEGHACAPCASRWDRCARDDPGFVPGGECTGSRYSLPGGSDDDTPLWEHGRTAPCSSAPSEHYRARRI